MRGRSRRSRRARLVLDMAFLLGGRIQRVFRMPPRAYGVGVSRGRRGEWCTQRAFRVVSVGKGATWGVAGHRCAWQAYRESCTAAQTAGYRGHVRANGCARVDVLGVAKLWQALTC